MSLSKAKRFKPDDESNTSKRKCKFNQDLKNQFPCFDFGKTEWHGHCKICDSEVSVGNSGARDLKAHIETEKHKRMIRDASTSQSMKNFIVQKPTPEAYAVWAAEGTLTFHTVKHHQPFRSMDCTGKLFRDIFKDSKIASKISCAHTKTEAILNAILSNHSVEMIMESLKNIPFLSIGTDSSNHGNLKMFPLVIQYLDLFDGVQVKLLDIKETSNEKAKTVGTLLVDALEKYSLTKKLNAFVGDNVNTNFGGLQRKPGENVFTYLKEMVNENLIGIGCPVHILNNAIHHGLNQFGSFDVECIISKIFNHFSIHTVRTADLKEFCDFVEIEYQTLLSHTRTRWLSLMPGVDRMLRMYPALRSYFLSTNDAPKVLEQFFNDDFGELHFLFVHSLMSIFHNKLKSMESESNSVIEILSIIDSVLECLKSRCDSKFVPISIRKVLTDLRNDDKDVECDKFLNSMFLVYNKTGEYLKKWSASLRHLQDFDWLDFKLGKELEYESVEKSVSFLDSKNVKINDDILFDQITNLKKLLKSKENDSEFFKKPSSLKICDFFAANSNISSYSEILKIAQYFFAIPAHNANCERIFSLINTQWSNKRNRLKLTTVTNIVMVQHNFKHFSCSEFHSYLGKNKKLLEKIGQVEKYHQ